MLLVFPFVTFIVPPAEDQIRLEREEIMGYVGGSLVIRHPAIDDIIVFAIFLAVRSPPQRRSFFLKG
jgi:hypothetical protein